MEKHKGIGAKHVNVGDMRDAVVALPPFEQQVRIVARVEELLQLCADLRARLTDQKTCQARMAEALIGRRLRPGRPDDAPGLELAA